eukprot:8764241-Alexandrium_andersonii.AAC.1
MRAVRGESRWPKTRRSGSGAAICVLRFGVRSGSLVLLLRSRAPSARRPLAGDNATSPLLHTLRLHGRPLFW